MIDTKSWPQWMVDLASDIERNYDKETRLMCEECSYDFDPDTYEDDEFDDYDEDDE